MCYWAVLFCDRLALNLLLNADFQVDEVLNLQSFQIYSSLDLWQIFIVDFTTFSVAMVKSVGNPQQNLHVCCEFDADLWWKASNVSGLGLHHGDMVHRFGGHLSIVSKGARIF